MIDEKFIAGIAKLFRETNTGNYEAFVSDKGKMKNLGTYSSKEEAAQASLKYRATRLADSMSAHGDSLEESKIVCDNYIGCPSGNIYNRHGHKMIGAVGRDGYLHVLLNGKNKNVHRIIAETFIDNPNDYEQVNHINGTKTDNRINNLEWCTRSHNLKHAYENGLEQKVTGEKHHNHKLTWDAVARIREAYSNQKSISDLAKEYGVDRSTIHSVVSNETWRKRDD